MKKEKDSKEIMENKNCLIGEEREKIEEGE